MWVLALCVCLCAQQVFSLIISQLRGLSSLTGSRTESVGIDNPVRYLLHNIATVSRRHMPTVKRGGGGTVVRCCEQNASSISSRILV